MGELGTPGGKGKSLRHLAAHRPADGRRRLPRGMAEAVPYPVPEWCESLLKAVETEHEAEAERIMRRIRQEGLVFT